MADWLGPRGEAALREALRKLRSMPSGGTGGGWLNPATPNSWLRQFELRANEVFPGGAGLAPYSDNALMVRWDPVAETYTVDEDADTYRVYWSNAPRDSTGAYFQAPLLVPQMRVWAVNFGDSWDIISGPTTTVYAKLTAQLNADEHKPATVWARDRLTGSMSSTGKVLEAYAPPWWDINSADDFELYLPANSWVCLDYDHASAVWHVRPYPEEITAWAKLSADLEAGSSAGANLYSHGGGGFSESSSAITVHATPLVIEKIPKDTPIEVRWMPRWQIWVIVNAACDTPNPSS